MPKSPEEYAHLEWLGYVQPVGLAVSVPAMLEAQCYINKNITGEHARFLDCLPRDKKDQIVPEITDFGAFAGKCLEWEAEDLIEVPQRVALSDEMSSLEVILPQYHETLRPTHAVPVFKPKEGETPWQMLIQTLPVGTGFDDPSEADSSRHWHAAPQLKFERLLRETHVPIGLLCNSRQLRLVYAPRGESSGHATFNVDEMVQVAGRPMFAALHMLLSADRMFTLGEKQRLPAILTNSRRYQNTVSTKLAEQVLAALYELMRGFQAANDVRRGELLRRVLEENPNHVYSGLLTVLMRLVFVLYAEDRDLMSSDPVYSNNYSVTGLFERLRSDKGRFPDTMDQRFGAWSQLLTLYRLVFEGGQHATFKLPARKGYLFDPDRYPFLEGRFADRRDDEPAPVPRISDGIIYNVLRNLLILDGERLSYRTLDVEQIGSVYETMMGFDLQVAQGQSIAIKPVKSHGAPATTNLDELLETPGKDRAKWIKDCTDQKITGEALKALKAAESIDDLLEALDKKIHKTVTPRVVSAGAIVLQPSDERRRSGSHYTPRSLTKPIVETTLEPILKQLVEPPQEEAAGEKTLLDTKGRKTKVQVIKSERDEEAARLAQEKGSPHPRQILNLKVCDIAMGSGAFLVETCRQLGDELVAAWHAHECVPTDIPPDEDEILYARRLIAQRCLYGVDKNPMAVDLSKLALWLATLAKDHAFTFLDHALRHGDSLVGLTAEQIAGFTWGTKARSQGTTFQSNIQSRLERATAERRKILDAREDAPYRDQEQRMAVADEALSLPRLIGDACLSAFFSEKKKKVREERCDELFGKLADWLQSGDITKRKPIGDAVHALRGKENPVPPFHWEIEFPEVFSRFAGAFDAFVGNPPFLSGADISRGFGYEYNDYLYEHFDGASRKADLCAFFFRRGFELLSRGGTMGLIATNTIGQTTTKKVGLEWMVAHGATIYAAAPSRPWPGEASVIVSHAWVINGTFSGPKAINGKPCSLISNELEATRPELNIKPTHLAANSEFCYEGSKLAGTGFFLDSETANEMIAADRRNSDVVKKCVGGRDLNEMLETVEPRWAIDMKERTEEQARTYALPFAHLEEHVKPQRLERDAARYPRMVEQWWKYFHARQGLYRYIDETKIGRALVRSRVCGMHMLRFIPTDWVFTEGVVVFCLDDFASFAALQCRVHDVWLTKYASTMKLDVRYVPLSCFRPFPFPLDWREHEALNASGRASYEYREEYIISRRMGMTDIYNRFNDPDETSEQTRNLRDLHDEMDRAVLRAYEWDDLAEKATCDFLLDYEEEEDDDPTAKKSKKKKPWRYRWPDDFRDEVLARLLELNEQRAKEEKLAGKTAEAKAKSDGAKPRGRKSTKKKEPKLF